MKETDLTLYGDSELSRRMFTDETCYLWVLGLTRPWAQWLELVADWEAEDPRAR